MIDKQVVDLFLVNLEVGTTDKKSLPLFAFFDASENMLEAVGDDSPQLRVIRNTHHSVRFPAAGLPISEDSTVVAL